LEIFWLDSVSIRGSSDGMKCPACDSELTMMQVGPVEVDACHGGCGGLWFDAFELKKVDENHETAGEHLIQVPRNPAVKLDTSRKRQCPRCEGVKLRRHQFRRESRVEVDHCPNCAGYWLDGGELERIRVELHPENQAQAGQQQLGMEVIRYMYRMRVEQRTAL
jgi:Zn-finger nucleic acid-binding protein